MTRDIKTFPVALTIAGFDGSGGAGILADCRTFQRMGVYGVGVLTAVVAQSPGSVSGFEVVSDALFEAQLTEVTRSFPIASAKTGMLAAESLIELVSEFFEREPGIPLVIDPVLVASAGERLTSSAALDAMCRRLFPCAALITPNRFEAEAILGMEIRNPNDLEEAASRFFDRFGCPCLVKGGHLDRCRGEVCDALCIGGVTEMLSAPELEVPDLHGTGCVLSAAITAGLAHGLSLRASVLQGRDKLRFWMQDHHTWMAKREIHAINALD